MKTTKKPQKNKNSDRLWQRFGFGLLLFLSHCAEPVSLFAQPQQSHTIVALQLARNQDQTIEKKDALKNVYSSPRHDPWWSRLHHLSLNSNEDLYNDLANHLTLQKKFIEQQWQSHLQLQQQLLNPFAQRLDLEKQYKTLEKRYQILQSLPEKKDLTSEKNYSQQSPYLGLGTNIEESAFFEDCLGSYQKTTHHYLQKKPLNQHHSIHHRQDLDTLLELKPWQILPLFWSDKKNEPLFFAHMHIKNRHTYWLKQHIYRLTTHHLQMIHPNIKLNDAASALLNKKEHGIAAFYEKCGSHFYSGYDKGQRHAVLYDMNIILKDEPLLTEVLQKRSHSPEDEDYVLEIIQRLKKEDKLLVHTHSLAHKDKILSKSTRFHELNQIFADFDFDIQSGGETDILTWHLSAYKDVFPEVQQSLEKSLSLGEALPKNPTKFKEERLWYHYQLYHYNIDCMYWINTLLANATSPWLDPIFSDKWLSHLKSLLPLFQEQNQAIAHSTKPCFQDNASLVCQTMVFQPLPIASHHDE